MKTREIVLTNDDLLEKAVKLTAIANQVRIIERLIENVEYSRIKGDDFAVHHQIQSGLLDDIGNNLSEIKDEVQAISNELCPD